MLVWDLLHKKLQRACVSVCAGPVACRIYVGLMLMWSIRPLP